MSAPSGYDKMLAGLPYENPDIDLIAMQTAAQEKLAIFNAMPASKVMEGVAMLRELLGSLGEGTVVFKPLAFEYGKHIFVGRNGLINSDCMFMDGAPITIGDNTLVAPRVQFITAGHATRHEDRVWRDAETGEDKGGYTINKPVSVGSRCWIGASSIVLPGVSIGDDTVIGAGSVVTKSIPAGVVAAGNPCRVIRRND